MIRVITELRQFMADINILHATWEERLLKLDEEMKEDREAELSGSFSDQVSEKADKAIVLGTMFLKAYDELAALGVNPGGAMVAKMDEVRRRN